MAATDHGISVIMALYDGVEPAHLHDALVSLSVQTLAPSEVVVVGDGALTERQEQTLRAFEDRLPLIRVQLPSRRGAGPARQAGLDVVTHEWVAVADADDVSLPCRFAEQRRRADDEGLTVVGAAMEEFGTATRPGQVRQAPLSMGDIRRRLGSNNPFNHPTVFVRTDAARAAGGYRDMPYLEDYDFVIRLLSIPGVTAANDPRPLVRYRLDQDTLRRRAVPGMLRREWRLQQTLRQHGHVSWARLCVNLLVRHGYRILPYHLRLWVHRNVLAKPSWRLWHARRA